MRLILKVVQYCLFFMAFAQTCGYEKSAPLPYPSQAHHKPLVTMEKHTLSAYSKCN